MVFSPQKASLPILRFKSLNLTSLELPNNHKVGCKCCTHSIQEIYCNFYCLCSVEMPRFPFCRHVWINPWSFSINTFKNVSHGVSVSCGETNLLLQALSRQRLATPLPCMEVNESSKTSGMSLGRAGGGGQHSSR